MRPLQIADGTISGWVHVQATALLALAATCRLFRTGCTWARLLSSSCHSTLACDEPIHGLKDLEMRPSHKD